MMPVTSSNDDVVVLENRSISRSRRTSASQSPRSSSEWFRCMKSSLWRRPVSLTATSGRTESVIQVMPCEVPNTGDMPSSSGRRRGTSAVKRTFHFEQPQIQQGAMPGTVDVKGHVQMARSGQSSGSKAPYNSDSIAAIPRCMKMET
jgi:hypothetical protein